MQNEVYTLSNGKSIEDPYISEKMYYIASVKPDEGHPVSGVGYARDESGMAQLFAECYQNDTRYCPEAKSWYTYSEGAWRKDVGALLVSAKIKEFYQLLTLYCGEIENTDRRTEFMKFVLKMGDRRFRDRLLKDASDNELLVVRANKFDANPNLVNCLNGTYDLTAMEFKPHSWSDFLTMQTNFEYTAEWTEPLCPRWEKFIHEVTMGDKEKAVYLQKALGYSMLGTANEECMFILHGKTTRNGKSTLLSAIHHLLGDYASVSPVSIICRSDRTKNAEAANPMLASLKGKRFVTMAESNQYGKLDEETIKQLTGGEEIKARNLYESAITFLPQFTLWLSCNDLPAVSDRSLFASERIRVIEFNRHFTEAEQDKNLKNEFQTPDAMKGIFTWLLEGYFLYKQKGLSMPPGIKAVVKQYERDNDIVLQFLDDKCDPAEGQTVKAKALYDSYKIWCRASGYFPFSAKRFYAEMDAHPEWHGGRVIRNGYPVYKDMVLKGV